MTQNFRKKHLLRDSGSLKQERAELLKRHKREVKGEAAPLLGEGEGIGNKYHPPPKRRVWKAHLVWKWNSDS